jgi:hypothetical protein
MAVDAGSRGDGRPCAGASCAPVACCADQRLSGVSTRAFRGRSALPVRVQSLFLCVSSGHVRACEVDNKLVSPLALKRNPRQHMHPSYWP